MVWFTSNLIGCKICKEILFVNNGEDKLRSSHVSAQSTFKAKFLKKTIHLFVLFHVHTDTINNNKKMLPDSSMKCSSGSTFSLIVLSLKIISGKTAKTKVKG